MKYKVFKYKIDTAQAFIITGLITGLVLGCIAIAFDNLAFIWLPSAVFSSISLLVGFVRYYPQITEYKKFTTRHLKSEYIFLVWLASLTAIIFTLSRPSVCFVRVGLLYEWATVLFLPCVFSCLWAIAATRYRNKALIGAIFIVFLISSLLWLPLSDSILLHSCDAPKQGSYKIVH